MSATCELLRGRDFNPYYGNVLELAVSHEVVGVGPMILPMSMRLQACACPLLLRSDNGQAGHVMDRCACSGSSW